MKKSIFLAVAAFGGMLFAANDVNAQEAVVVEEEVEEEVLNMDITYTNASSEEYQREYVVTNYDEEELEDPEEILPQNEVVAE